MADAVLYLIRAVPDQGAGWREAVEMALTGAAFGIDTTVWLARAPLVHLSRRTDADDPISELADFGVRCVAARADLPAALSEASCTKPTPKGIELLSSDDLAALHQTHQLIVF